MLERSDRSQGASWIGRRVDDRFDVAQAAMTVCRVGDRRATTSSPTGLERRDVYSRLTALRASLGASRSDTPASPLNQHRDTASPAFPVRSCAVRVFDRRGVPKSLCLMSPFPIQVPEVAAVEVTHAVSRWPAARPRRARTVRLGPHAPYPGPITKDRVAFRYPPLRTCKPA